MNMRDITKPLVVRTNRLIALHVLTATLSLCLGIYIGDRQADRGPEIAATRGERLYLDLVGMGMARWQMACAHAKGRSGVPWPKAEDDCSLSFLDDISKGGTKP